MEYVLAIHLFSAACTIKQIPFDCPKEGEIYGQILFNSEPECRAYAESGQAVADILKDRIIRKWKVPHCEPYTREVALKIAAGKGI